MKRKYQPRQTYQKLALSGISKINNRPAHTRAYVDFIYLEFEFGITSTLGVGGIYQFNLNSLFDPNRTGVGHQPTNFDQLMAIYEEYIVTDCEYKVVMRDATGGTVGQLCAVNCTDQGNATDIDPRNWIENGIAQWDVIDVQKPITTFTGKVAMDKLHGISRSQLLSNGRYRGRATSNPVDVALLTLYMNTLNSASTSSVTCVVELRFKSILEGTRINAIS